jgi:hypothetical protein
MKSGYRTLLLVTLIVAGCSHPKGENADVSKQAELSGEQARAALIELVEEKRGDKNPVWKSFTSEEAIKSLKDGPIEPMDGGSFCIGDRWGYNRNKLEFWGKFYVYGLTGTFQPASDGKWKARTSGLYVE